MSYPKRIQQSSLSIYDLITVGDPDLWIPSEELEAILNAGLRGRNFGPLPLRTRSRVFNEEICRILGYPVPATFKKTKPRFPGQNFDKYVQKANNLQVWNDELDATRRYVIIRLAENEEILLVKVVTGADLALLDKTGTLTQKYQARLVPNPGVPVEFISANDTERLIPLLHQGGGNFLISVVPNARPLRGQLLPIKEIGLRLKQLLGIEFKDSGLDQERNRGAALHGLVCKALGYSSYEDDGRFPDVKNQLLEVKLQTSPTIDLGLVTPSSEAALDLPQIAGITVRHCDVRYALFYGTNIGGMVKITNLYITTGQDFFSRFPQFQGKVLNKKLQIPLPSSFFSSNAKSIKDEGVEFDF